MRGQNSQRMHRSKSNEQLWDCSNHAQCKDTEVEIEVRFETQSVLRMQVVDNATNDWLLATTNRLPISDSHFIELQLKITQ